MCVYIYMLYVGNRDREGTNPPGDCQSSLGSDARTGTPTHASTTH